MEWIIENKAWLFSGIAVTVPLALIGWLFFTRKDKQVQNSGKNSTNIQVGGDFKIVDKSDDE